LCLRELTCAREAIILAARGNEGLRLDGETVGGDEISSSALPREAGN
jgi:hypothetical protein